MVDILTELLRDLRKHKTQEKLSQELGYRFNQVYRWEAGIKRMLWEDLIAFALGCKFDINQALQKTFHVKNTFLTTVSFLEFILEQNERKHVCELLKISRFTLTNYLNRKSNIPANLILDYLSQKGLILRFLDLLFGHENYSTLSKLKNKRAELNKLLLENFRYGFVIHFLLSEEYMQLPKLAKGMIAKRFGLSIEQEQTLWYRLEKIGVIYKKDQKYFFNDQDGTFVRDRDPSVQTKMMLEICKLNEKHINNSNKINSPILSDFQLYCISENALVQIKNIFSDAHHKVYDIIANDKRQGKMYNIAASQFMLDIH